MYLATVTLRRTEAEFWEMTPRHLFLLADVHSSIYDRDGDEPPEVNIEDVVF